MRKIKKIFIILFFFQSLCYVGIGQIMDFSFEGEALESLPVAIYIDSTATKKIEEIKLFKFLANKKIVISNLAKPSFNYWLKFRIANTREDTLFRIVEIEKQERIEFYELKNGQQISYNEGGSLTSIRNRNPPNPSAFPVAIPPKESYDYFVKINILVSSKIGMDTLDFKVALLTKKEEKSKRLNHLLQSLNYYIFNIAFLAISFFTSLFSFIHWSYNKDKSYLYYAGYTFAIFLYFLRKVEIYYFGNNVMFAYIAEWYYFAEILISLFIYSMYIFFIQEFLDIKNTNIKWYRIAITGGWAIGFYGITMVFSLFFFSQQIIYLSFLAIRLGLAILGFFYIYHVIKADQILHKIILLGTAFLMVVSLSGMTMELLLPSYGTYRKMTNEPLFYSQIGVIGELLIFSIGLAYKTNLLHQEKLDSERAALAARMKPHFISNGLNSIKSLIQYGKNKEAKIYLAKFAALLRNIIEYSTEDLISLKQELDLSESYLKIEGLRFEGEFISSIYLDEEIDITNVLIPPLILQPHLENAIKHGLRSVDDVTWDNLVIKRKKKELILKIYHEKDYIKCIIEDNGIGRAMSTENKSTHRTHKSIGLQTTKKRLKQFGMIQKVIDKIDKNGNPLGTRIEIIIPNKNNNHA